MNVVNDSAERTVKDVSDYSRGPTRRDEVVHLVNHHRYLIEFRHLTKDQLAQI